MSLVIQSVKLNYFSKIEFHKYMINNLKGLNPVLKDQNVVIYKVAIFIYYFVLLRIFYKGVVCTIKS